METIKKISKDTIEISCEKPVSEYLKSLNQRKEMIQMMIDSQTQQLADVNTQIDALTGAGFDLEKVNGKISEGVVPTPI